jgi:hypothetical protein
VTDGEKHSGLLQYGITYERKKLNGAGPPMTVTFFLPHPSCQIEKVSI